MNNRIKWQPFIYGLLIGLGIAIGIWLKPATSSGGSFFSKGNKISEILRIIERAYVDTVDTKAIEETAIEQLLTQLDPHSVYIAAEDLKRSNEQLEGEFEGIGVEFSILNDTIIVVTPLNGGPSKELGISPGDRIVEVDGKNIAGTGITNDQVFKLLRGEKGSKVNVKILRPGARQLLTYNITRSKIPIYSVDIRMMLDEQTGYIKVSRFASTTYDEFTAAVKELQMQKMQNLVLDLRGNPGGYLTAVTQMVDEVLSGKKLIVYTEGRTQPRNDYFTDKQGVFEQGKLVVLIDEGSASASEIFAGAVQDHDRGIIIGRRSFGKGLVQEPFELSDGSAMRLTISRYYTPSGRYIQKPYENAEVYEHEILSRLEDGELEDSSKMKIADTTVFKTSRGRIVYGGGGIMPDIFVAIDTSFQTDYLTEILSNSMFTQFAVDYTDKNRKALRTFKTAADFNTRFHADLVSALVSFTSVKGVRPSAKDLSRSRDYLETHAKALIARQLFRDEGYFTVLNSSDRIISKALQSLGNYEKMMSGSK